MELGEIASRRGLHNPFREPPSIEDEATINLRECSEQAEDFLQNQGGRIHPIFETDDKYLQQRASAPVSDAFNPMVHQHAEQFLQVMEAYQASMKVPGNKPFDVRGTHSWDEVLRVAKDAEAAHLRAGRKPFRKIARIVTDSSDAVVPTLRLIPNGFFTSVIAGGLKLVFEAAARISESRQHALETLLRIPGLINEAEDCVENFPSDFALYDKAADLYLATLAVIEGITRRLTQESAWKHALALVPGSLYSKSFKGKIRALNESLDSLQRRVSTLRDRSIVRTEKALQDVETSVRKVEDNGNVVTVTTEATLHEVKDLHLDLRQSRDENRTNFERLSDIQQAKEEAHRAMKVVLDETAKTSKWMKKKDRVIERLQEQIKILEKAAISLNTTDLLDIMGVGDHSPTKDLKQSLRAGQSMELTATLAAQGTIENIKFKEWLSTDMSTALLVEGSYHFADFGRSTPVSLMSSFVIDSLQDKDPAIPLHFFCGSHSSSSDPFRGPQGLMRSLICQLVDRCTFELDFISTRRYREQLECFNVRILCDCFRKLVERVSMDATLFCIIDSISFFERKEWAESCRFVVNELQDLADDEAAVPRATFKLLITSPSRTRCFVDIIPPERHLLLPSADDESGRNGATERQVSMRSRRPSRIVGNNEILRLSRQNTYVDRRTEDWDRLSDSDAATDGGAK